MVTGAAGFIGSHFVDFVLKNHPEDMVIGFDCLTYAGNMHNLEAALASNKFEFVKGDIRNSNEVNSIVSKVDAVVNFAAETHVDRSIVSASDFVSTNVLGTNVLLQAALDSNLGIFHQISTDEVYGSISSGRSQEDAKLNPSSPYSASKASADLLVHSYQQTHGLNTRITRASNNYGIRQFPEKLIPLFVTNLLNNKPVPIYGTGENIRDWLSVYDHVCGVYLALTRGKTGAIYNLGGDNEMTNLEIITLLADLINAKRDLLINVADRKGHDFRYSINSNKARKELGYKVERNFRAEIEVLISHFKNQMASDIS